MLYTKSTDKSGYFVSAENAKEIAERYADYIRTNENGIKEFQLAQFKELSIEQDTRRANKVAIKQKLATCDDSEELSLTSMLNACVEQVEKNATVIDHLKTTYVFVEFEVVKGKRGRASLEGETQVENARIHTFETEEFADKYQLILVGKSIKFFRLSDCVVCTVSIPRSTTDDNAENENTENENTENENEQTDNS